MSHTPNTIDPANYRRVVTGLTPDGRSTFIIDGPPAEVVNAGTSSLFEIWSDEGEVVDIADSTDRGKGPISLMPRPSGMLVRWFTIYPEGERVADDDVEGRFDAMGGGAELVPTDEYPGMHRTKSVDMTVVLSGSMKLITEDAETILNAGDAVVMRGTAHDWKALNGEPAHCFCVVVDRDVK